jgi:CHAT domain-containing protein
MGELTNQAAVTLAEELAEATAEIYDKDLASGNAAGALASLTELARRLDEILAVTGARDDGYARVALIAACVQMEIWVLTEDPARLRALIRCARAGLDSYPDPATALDLRFNLATGLADLSRAEGRCFSAAAGISGDAGAARRLAAARAARDEAIELLDTVLAEIGPGGSASGDVAGMLGSLHYSRFSDRRAGASGGTPSDLDAAISLLTLAVDAGQGAEQELEFLVLALSDRLDAGEEPADRDAVIARAQQFTALPGVSPQDTALIHDIAASALLDRAQEPAATRRQDLDAAVRHWEMALRAASPDDPDRAGTLASLAFTCWLRLDGMATDHRRVDEMTGYAEQAWHLLPPGEPIRADIGIYLAVGVYERLRRPGEPFELASASLAIDVLTEVVPELTAERELYLLGAVTLGVFLVGRGQATGSAADMLAAQPWLVRAAEEVPVDDPKWAEVTQSLAAAMSGVVLAGFSGEQLDRAIGLLAIVADRSGSGPGQLLARAACGAALIQRAGFTSSAADMDLGIEHLRAVFDLVPEGDATRLVIAWNLGSALLARYNLRGDRQDVDAAEYYASAISHLGDTAQEAVRELFVDADIMATAMRGIVTATRAGFSGDVTLFDEAAASLRAALALMPPGHHLHARISSDLGLTLLMRAAYAGDQEGLREQAPELTAAAAAFPAGHLMKPLVLLRACGMLAAAGASLGNPGLLREAARNLHEVLGSLDPRFGERPRFTALAGLTYKTLHGLTGDPADLDAAAHWLAAACDDFGRERGHPLLAVSLMELAGVYERRGDTSLARGTGLAALRERGRDVLLQTGTARALSRSAAVAAEAAEIASWCLAEGNPDAAVETLELGRGLVLHAATSVALISELLDGIGEAGLAGEWRRAAAAPHRDAPWDLGGGAAGQVEALLNGAVAMEMPSDVRARSLAALAGTATDRLLAPPATREIAAALAATGKDALVYLLAPGPGLTGRAIVIHASGAHAAAAEVISLPLLRDGTSGALHDHAAVLAASLETREPGAGQPAGASGPDLAASRWRDALRRVCEWAWPAVIGPVLAHVRGRLPGRLPRLVLVPTQQLSLVPWHAACWQPAGADQRRYACQEAVISYAASGRQLIDVSQRPALPLRQRPVVLGDPARKLPFSTREAQAIYDACYQGGAYFGYVGPLWHGQAAGPGSGGEVLAQLPTASSPGASMLHLGCHASVVGGAPGRSFLELAGGEKLMVEEILRRASGRAPQAPGGLISLAACQSDLAVHEYDEALTLATAFLAAGAVTVVGARWKIPDGPSSLQMFMFHHYLAAGSHPPADALRMAQLWMLDPDRQPPPGMPPALARHARNPQLREESIWAAVTHQGR